MALVALIASSLSHGTPATKSAGVAVLRATEWSPADAARDGAGEFEVWLRVAQVQRAHATAGVLAIGDRNGVFRSGGERALRQVALAGVVVVKLAPNGEVAVSPDGLFLDAQNLSAEKAARVLTRGLERFGAPPAAADLTAPTPHECSAIRAHLKKFQALIAAELAAPVLLAALP